MGTAAADRHAVDPPALVILDGLARARRRREPLGRWSAWALACGLPFRCARCSRSCWASSARCSHSARPRCWQARCRSTTLRLRPCWHARSCSGWPGWHGRCSCGGWVWRSPDARGARRVRCRGDRVAARAAARRLRGLGARPLRGAAGHAGVAPAAGIASPSVAPPDRERWDCSCSRWSRWDCS